eukprot:scaffold72920_cov75-Phaeocystis_antarctica.AAC.2
MARAARAVAEAGLGPLTLCHQRSSRRSYAGPGSAPRSKGAPVSHNRAASPVLGRCSTSAGGAGANRSPWERMHSCSSCASSQGSESHSTACHTHGTHRCGPLF